MTCTRAIAAFIDWLKKRLTKPANRMPYTGERKDNKRHGQGTVTIAAGTGHTGEWNDGKARGQGTKTDTGTWKNGKFNGHGAYTWPDGSRYIG